MTRRSTPAWMLSAAVAAMLSLSSCPGILSGDPWDPYTQKVGPAGGIVSNPGIVELVIPAGALAEEVSITVTTCQDTASLGMLHPGLVGALCGVVLEPDGLEFVEPVTLRISSTRSLAEGSYPVFCQDPTANVWAQTGTAQVLDDGYVLEMSIGHFSSHSVFDLPYGILDDFDEYVAEHMELYPEDSAADLGELYAECYIFEVESFCGQDQYYNGCCYMRCGAEVALSYTYGGTPYSYTGSYGYTSDRSVSLSYSGSTAELSYSIDLVVYLDCSDAESTFFLVAGESALQSGESTAVTAVFQCGGEPIPGREVSFSLEGPGRISSASATTDARGEAEISYTATEDGTATITGRLEGCSCSTGTSGTEDTVSVTIGGEAWSGSMTYTHHFATAIPVEDSHYEVALGFVASYGAQTGTTISGIATASQEATVVSVNRNFWIENIVAPGTLELVVEGYLCDADLYLVFKRADGAPLFSYDYNGGSMSAPQSETFDELFIFPGDSAIPLRAGTYSGSRVLDPTNYRDDYTITLERAQ